MWSNTLKSVDNWLQQLQGLEEKRLKIGLPAVNLRKYKMAPNVEKSTLWGYFRIKEGEGYIEKEEEKE